MNRSYWVALGRSCARSRTLPSQSGQPRGGWQREAFDLGYLMGSMP